MNKQYYSFGNPFKVKFREHNCYKCGAKLFIVNHHKVVSQKSEEAKYYDFSVGVDGGIMVGPCEFIHKVFYCPKCSENIEFVTQLNQEDIDILIDKVKTYYKDKGRKISITKTFDHQENAMKDTSLKIEQIQNLCLIIEENGKESLIYQIPIRRKKNWERPCYFRVTKKQVLDFINQKAHQGKRYK